MDISSAGTVVALTGALAYAAACLALAHRHTRAWPKPPARGVAAFDRVDFAARDGRARVCGEYLPAPAGRAAVVLVNGRDRWRNRELAQALCAQGLSVLSIDLRGRGGSSAHRGSFGRHERHDVLGAVDYLLERGHPPGRIGVMGSGIGANAVLGAAADEPAIRAVLAEGTGPTLDRALRRQWQALPWLAATLAPGVQAAAWWLGSASLDDDWLRRRIGALRGRALQLDSGRTAAGSAAAHTARTARAAAFFCQHLTTPRTVCVIWPEPARATPAVAWERLAA
ncbi:alpha/beta hydrolase [Rhizobacter sp. OV335]|uniref:alpha/beta hydrolase n=1 Tax=Rhizobacter sp. OV335 TaxID=1500264 RepID=UPI000912DF5B|nr:alpha/beta hydrolase [Rhizobacter sp. OV335]SHM43123.1 Serine aminopeptidase, S33 [Rhizobacter sp. OV335]